MSGMNLGKLLAEAGVKGGKPVAPKPTFEEIRAAARKEPEEVYSQEAMNRLPAEFTELGETSKGEEFMCTLERIIQRREWDAADGNQVFEFTEHTVYGIVQLAHHHRDRLQGSRRKSFSRIIPKLLEVKTEMEKRNPANVAEFFSRKLWPPPAPPSKERQRWSPQMDAERKRLAEEDLIYG